MSPGSPVSAEASWAGALAGAREARIVLVLGASDTGKTSLVTYLADALLAAGGSLAVVDADLGQSEIGPPTTVGLGYLRGRVARLADAEVAGLHFVGATSPRGHLLETVLGTRRMTERALALGVDRVIVDTSGLVQGELGRLLKQAKIDLIVPDLLVCLQRGAECEPILRPYGEGRFPAIVRLGAAPAARRRSTEERRQRREHAMQAYFAGGRRVTLDLDRVVLQEPQLREFAARHPDTHSLGDFQDVLAGLDDRGRQTVGLGVVRAVDFIKRAMVVETPVPEHAIAGVRLGRHRIH